MKDFAEEWKALDAALDLHERAPLVGSLFVKILVAAGYSNSEIQLAAATIIAYAE